MVPPMDSLPQSHHHPPLISYSWITDDLQDPEMHQQPPATLTTSSMYHIHNSYIIRVFFLVIVALSMLPYEYLVRVILHDLIKQLKKICRKSLSLGISYEDATRARKRGGNVKVITSGKSARIPRRYPKLWALSKLISLPPILRVIDVK
jgi:hypothetical protein